MKDVAKFLARFTSRKFLLVLAVLGLVATSTLSPEELDKVVAVVIAFIGAEGLADTAQRFQAEKTKQTENVLKDTAIQFNALDDPSGVDRGTIVSGNDIAM